MFLRGGSVQQVEGLARQQVLWGGRPKIGSRVKMQGKPDKMARCRASCDFQLTKMCVRV